MPHPRLEVMGLLRRMQSFLVPQAVPYDLVMSRLWEPLRHTTCLQIQTWELRQRTPPILRDALQVRSPISTPMRALYVHFNSFQKSRRPFFLLMNFVGNYKSVQTALG